MRRVVGNTRSRNVTTYVGSLLLSFSDAGSTPAASTIFFTYEQLPQTPDSRFWSDGPDKHNPAMGGTQVSFRRGGSRVFKWSSGQLRQNSTFPLDGLPSAGCPSQLPCVFGDS